MKKRLWALGIVFILCLSLTVPAFAANSDFIIENGVLTKYVGPGGNVIIPDGVYHINDSAFAGCKNMTSVTIPDSVRLINHHAFIGCTGLTSLTIPSGVEIGSESFRNCTGLTNLTLCDGVGFIHAGAFYGCTGLTSVTIPDSVPTLDGDVFRDCTSLTNVIIPESLTDIRSNPFTNTPWFKNQFDIQGEFVTINGTLVGYNGADTDLTFPYGITTIGSAWKSTAGYTFSDDPAYEVILTNVTIPDSVKTIQGGAFWWCRGLKNITIPNSVTTIEYRAFAECTGLTSVTIPNSVTTLGAWVFENCINLTSVTIPSSVTYIDSNPFIGCSKVTVHGETGSYIETYAKENGIPFVADVGTSSISPTVSGFRDVKESDYFVDAVKWAVAKNVTSGTSSTTFSPNQTCTVGQILTFLWRANGSPEPTIKNPYSNIKESDYYYKALLWATELDLIAGDEGIFNANMPCTRIMAVFFMWKTTTPTYDPAAGETQLFTDVPIGGFGDQAVHWAVQKGITSGTSATTFSPEATCTRGQIATFLYRAYGK